jgi:hypothetical protein
MGEVVRWQINHEGTKDTKKTGWWFDELRNVRARQDL